MDNITYRFVAAIMNVTAAVAIKIPIIMFAVSASPKTSVPTRIAVTGSNTPSTEAFVAPMFLVAIASIAVDTMVGRIASPTRLPQAEYPSIPVVTPPSESKILPRKMIAPIEST